MKLQLVIFCVLGMLAQSAIAQEDPTAEAPAATGLATTQNFAPRNSASYSPFFPMNSAQKTWRQAANQEMREAINSYKEAGDDQEKASAAGQIRGVLEGQYDNLIKDYEEHLNAMEKKIEKMRDQIQKRRSAKGEMVELRLQMMIKEAEGLGWPDDRPSGLFGRNPFSVIRPSNLYSGSSTGSGQSR